MQKMATSYLVGCLDFTALSFVSLADVCKYWYLKSGPKVPKKLDKIQVAVFYLSSKIIVFSI